jgi:hypothetical protein
LQADNQLQLRVDITGVVGSNGSRPVSRYIQHTLCPLLLEQVAQRSPKACVRSVAAAGKLASPAGW